MKYDNSIEARKKRVLRAKDMGIIINEAPYFVDGMTDYEFEKEQERYDEYTSTHGTNEGFVPMKVPEGRI